MVSLSVSALGGSCFQTGKVISVQRSSRWPSGVYFQEKPAVQPVASHHEARSSLNRFVTRAKSLGALSFS